MANHKSAKKRAKQTIVRTERNKARTGETRSAIKSLRAAIEANDKETAVKLVPRVQKLLSKLAKAGIVKQNTAARRTSRLVSQATKL